MKFEKIPNNNAHERFGHVKSSDAFYRFVNDFEIVGVKWSQPTNISASYFLRVLQEGSSARPRGYGKNSGTEHDEASSQLNEFYSSLLDHGALWKMKNGRVICTAMPYGDLTYINDRFNELVNKFQYPSTIKMKQIDEKYRFRPNGDCMIVIYCELDNEDCEGNYSIDNLRKKAILRSSPAIFRYQEASGRYNRDPFVSMFAKKRAQGVCQLCNNQAPFLNREGEPFLETHHIKPLSEGGADSIGNTVALCPNCHRKMHILNLKEDVEVLIENAMAEEYFCDE